MLLTRLYVAAVLPFGSTALAQPKRSRRVCNLLCLVGLLLMLSTTGRASDDQTEAESRIRTAVTELSSVHPSLSEPYGPTSAPYSSVIADVLVSSWASGADQQDTSTIAQTLDWYVASIPGVIDLCANLEEGELPRRVTKARLERYVPEVVRQAIALNATPELYSARLAEYHAYIERARKLIDEFYLGKEVCIPIDNLPEEVRELFANWDLGMYDNQEAVRLAKGRLLSDLMYLEINHSNVWFRPRPEVASNLILAGKDLLFMQDSEQALAKLTETFRQAQSQTTDGSGRIYFHPFGMMMTLRIWHLGPADSFKRGIESRSVGSSNSTIDPDDEWFCFRYEGRPKPASPTQ